jgi:hypothetical protein
VTWRPTFYPPIDELRLRPMANASRFGEDLPLLAADAFRVANRLCGPCKNFHILWPHRRIAEAVGGSGDRIVLSALDKLVSKSGRKILIAGCADTGLLATVARCANFHVKSG